MNVNQTKIKIFTSGFKQLLKKRFKNVMIASKIESLMFQVKKLIFRLK